MVVDTTLVQLAKNTKLKNAGKINYENISLSKTNNILTIDSFRS